MNEGEKLENLRVLYQELHVSRRTSETQQNRIAFAFSTIFLLLAGLFLKGDYKLPDESYLGIAVVLILSAMVIGVIYILAIWVVNKERYGMIVRVEQALGFHQENIYMTTEDVMSYSIRPYDMATILPPVSQRWGKKRTRYTFLLANLSSVCVSGTVAIVVLFTLY